MHKIKNLHSGHLDRDILEEPHVAMEDACFNGLLDKLQDALKQYSYSDNKIHQEWVRVYKLFYQRSSSSITPESLMEAVQYKTSDVPSLFIAYRILQAYAAYDLAEYGMFSSMCNTIIEEMKKIRGSKLELFYRNRLSLLLTYLYLWQNEVIQARQQAQFIIDFCPQNTYIAYAYHALGLSYLYADSDKGNNALEKSLQMYQYSNKKNEITLVKRDIFFFNNYWGNHGKSIQFIDQIKDYKELAHFEIRRGNKVKAEQILLKIDLHSLNLREQGYYYFYKGLATDNKDLFYKSIEIFKKIEDKFFSKMACQELYRRGDRPAAIEAAYN